MRVCSSSSLLLFICLCFINSPKYGTESVFILGHITVNFDTGTVSILHLKKYLLDFHDEKSNPESYVFYSRNTGVNGKMSQAAINKQLRKYAASARFTCDEVPINLHAHQIRHAKASHWLEDGMNIVQISFLLGHSNIQTTMGYLDITTEQEARALATLEGEDKKDVPKKWKSGINSLASFCGVNEIKA